MTETVKSTNTNSTPVEVNSNANSIRQTIKSFEDKIGIKRGGNAGMNNPGFLDQDGTGKTQPGETKSSR